MSDERPQGREFPQGSSEEIAAAQVENEKWPGQVRLSADHERLRQKHEAMGIKDLELTKRREGKSSIEVIKGEIEGRAVSLRYEDHGDNWHVTYSGSIDGDGIDSVSAADLWHKYRKLTGDVDTKERRKEDSIKALLGKKL